MINDVKTILFIRNRHLTNDRLVHVIFIMVIGYSILKKYREIIEQWSGPSSLAHWIISANCSSSRQNSTPLEKQVPFYFHLLTLYWPIVEDIDPTMARSWPTILFQLRYARCSSCYNAKIQQMRQVHSMALGRLHQRLVEVGPTSPTLPQSRPVAGSLQQQSQHWMTRPDGEPVNKSGVSSAVDSVSRALNAD